MDEGGKSIGGTGDDTGDDTVIRADETVISVDETVISADETVISADDTVISADDTVITLAREDPLTQATQPTQRIPEVPPEPPRAVVAFFLRTVTGARHSLEHPVVFGRAPQVARRDRNDIVTLVIVPSREGRVSATHVELRQVGDVVVVTDLKSTNGTTVILVGGTHVQLSPGDSMALGVGAIVDIGDGNRIEVLRETPS
jgi:pSer/pThr/pTyr-binding forkhead associated (FHA) protein